MGFAQTATHRSGRDSYHQIGIVRGQYGDVPEDQFLDFIAAAGFDGWEEASWEIGLERIGDGEGARALAEERVAKAKSRGLEIFSISTHLQGQALGDEPSAKTLQFIGGEAVEAYKAWRANHEPPRNDPYFVPDEVGQLIHASALASMIRCAQLSKFVGEIENRRIPLPGFCGSPAGCWSHFFLFPPLPKEIGGYSIADVRKISLELLVERFAPFFEVCRSEGTTFDLECHPSERAMGDIESAREYLDFMHDAGYGDVVGFNLDASHMVWQGVSPVQFIREFRDHIHCVHIKGVQVSEVPTRAGRLGGHRDMGDAENAWNFVTAGSGRDAVNNEELIVELNRIGFDGALTIEWEDNDVDKLAGARASLAHIRSIDHPPSMSKHDDTLKA